MSDYRPYGTNDNSYRAAGCIEGLTRLANAFYHHMNTRSDAKSIRDMHISDLAESSKKLAFFLSGWLGGPKLYSENYGPIAIPRAHSHLPIGRNESDAWIRCMQLAIDEQPYSPDFKVYLIEQLRVPASRIEQACAANQRN